MSMLVHGFIDDPNGSDFRLDESDPMAYSVVRMRNHASPIGALVTGCVVILIVIAVIYFG